MVEICFFKCTLVLWKIFTWKYLGEEGQDAGGLLREWYVIISREIFNPNYALFKSSPGKFVCRFRRSVVTL